MARKKMDAYGRELDANGRPPGFGVAASPQQTQLDLERKALDAQKAKLAAQPKLGNYQGATNAKGQLKGAYKLTDPGARESPWIKQMLQQQSDMQTQALNRGAQQAATGAASAQASLARRGGLSSGSAERLANAAQEQRTLGAQDIYGKGAAQRLDMQTNDMQQERTYQTGLQQSNIQNALTDLGQRQQFDLGKYSEQMKGWAADKAAKATENAGGGSVICTALKDVGIINDSKHRRAQMFKEKVDLDTYHAYLTWGVPVANAIRVIPALGYLFLPLVRYWAGDRDLLAVAQYRILNAFNKLFKRKLFVRAK